MLGDCYSFNKVCLQDSGMLPCTPGSNSVQGSQSGSAPGTSGTSGSDDCDTIVSGNAWFWIMAGLAGVALIVNNNGGGR